MAVFQRDSSSRQFYSFSWDDFPTAENIPGMAGGIPAASRLTHLNTGDRFIYDGNEWHPTTDIEDVVDATEQVVQLLIEAKETQDLIARAIFQLANEVPNGDRFFLDGAPIFS